VTERPILLLAETGFVIRNLLLGTFSDVVMRERPLVVAVPDPSQEALQALVDGKPLRFVPFCVEPDQADLGRMQKLRSWQTYIHWFKQAHKTWDEIELEHRLFGWRHSRLGWAGLRALTEAGRVLRRTRMLTLVEGAYLDAVGRWPATEQWAQVLECLRPAAVVSTVLTLATKNRPSHDLPAVVAAHRHGIPCGTLVQSWDNLTNKAAVIPPWLDCYWTWSEAMTEELLRLYPGIRPERTKVVGSPQFDFHTRQDLVEPRETYFARVGLDPDRPLLLIGTGTRARLPGEPDTVLELVRAVRDRLPRVQFLVRLHPKDAGDRWKRLCAEAGGVVIQRTAPRVAMDHGGFVPPAEFYREQVNALVHAAVVVNMSSTLTVDAAILDRPVICVAYDAVADPQIPEGRAWIYAHSPHYGPLVRTGGVRLIRNAAECVLAVEAYLRDPGLDRLGRRRIAAMVAGSADGGAGERLAREALALANGRRGEG
jgi:hypothetical protein